MANYLRIWDDWEFWEEDEEFEAAQEIVARRRRRIVKDRMNPFTSMSDEEFIDRFRLRKDSTHDLIEKIKDDLVATTDSRGCPVPPYLQFLIAMRCMATGDHQRTVADCHDVSQTTVSECLKTVSRAVASRSRKLHMSSLWQ
ncbi:uncharacterized protein LOC123502263 [Portunus trituberculatus]|uniref:uncharacterized protein LOC123502263 n=1 Tax=Portunus trituberculatus TaxID=210409 RepID=UPI001E1CCD3A|nr:uncharacterized protein LOC123502263 [Portunus trituberculatus]